METKETVVIKQEGSLCDKYEGELKKQLSGILPLILCIILTVAAAINFIGMITSFSKSIVLALGKLLPFLFFLLSCIGMWKVWTGAKNNDSHFIDNFNLAKTLPKYQQVMAIFATILVTIVVFIILVIAKSLKEFSNNFGDALRTIGGSDLANAVGEAGNIGMAVIALIGILAITYEVFTVILYSKIHKIAKTIMVSFNRKEFPELSLMFPAVVCFIVAVVEIVVGIMTRFLGAFNVLSSIMTALSVACVGVMFIMFNIKYKELRA